MLVHNGSERPGRGGRRSWPRKRSRPLHDLWRGRDGAERGVGPKGVVVPAPALDHDLRLLEQIEDLAVEQLVPELTCVTPIERIASATGRPCAVTISTCRSFATISSALCLFLDIDPSSFGSREPYLRDDHSSGGRPGVPPEPPVSADPGKEPLHHPAPRVNRKADLIGRLGRARPCPP